MEAVHWVRQQDKVASLHQKQQASKRAGRPPRTCRAGGTLEVITGKGMDGRRTEQGEAVLRDQVKDPSRACG